MVFTNKEAPMYIPPNPPALIRSNAFHEADPTSAAIISQIDAANRSTHTPPPPADRSVSTLASSKPS
jgi:hypothetical protein